MSRLLFTDNVPAGLDVLQLCHFAAILRKSNEPLPPIVVAPIGGTGLYRVTDGRHRVVAAYIAGRTDIEYEIDLDPPEDQRAADLLEYGL